LGKIFPLPQADKQLNLNNDNNGIKNTKNTKQLNLNNDNNGIKNTKNTKQVNLDILNTLDENKKKLPNQKEKETVDSNNINILIENPPQGNPEQNPNI
jgi:hypothetical protein